IGAVLGLAVGHALAQWVLGRFGADLGAGFFRGIAPQAQLDIGAMALFGLVGIAAAIAGSVSAAFEAARAEPARALRAGDEEHAFSRLNRVWPGIALMIAGGLLTLAPPMEGLPYAGYASIALLL